MIKYECDYKIRKIIIMEKLTARAAAPSIWVCCELAPIWDEFDVLPFFPGFRPFFLFIFLASAELMVT